MITQTVVDEGANQIGIGLISQDNLDDTELYSNPYDCPENISDDEEGHGLGELLECVDQHFLMEKLSGTFSKSMI